MSRLALPLAAGVLLALAGLAVVGLLRPSGASDAATLATELRCPDCEGLSVAESPTRSAAAIRSQITALLADGATPDQVRQHFVDRYGEWILLSPRSPLPWLAPIAALAMGVAGFWTWLRRPRPPALAPPAAAPRTDAARRVADEAEALDA